MSTRTIFPVTFTALCVMLPPLLNDKFHGIPDGNTEAYNAYNEAYNAHYHLLPTHMVVIHL